MIVVQVASHKNLNLPLTIVYQNPTLVLKKMISKSKITYRAQMKMIISNNGKDNINLLKLNSN